MSDAEHQDFILHNISQLIVNHDIRIFLEHNLKLIAQERSFAADWPGEEIIKRLVQNAGGLFIWAATAYHFIREGKRFAARRLDQILEYGSTAINAPEKHLNKIYITVLRHCISPHYTDREVEELVSMLKSLLGSIATLLSPLSTHSLSKLLSTRQDELRQTLNDLHAILDIPKDSSRPLRLHHPSFRDFLFDQTRCEEFWVDRKQAHQVLADSCIRLMSGSLKQDILGVDQPGTLVTDVEANQVEQHLPPEVQYACLYWIEHVLQSEAQLHDGDKAEYFLQEHLLHWLEALGWMGKVSEGVHAITSLGSFTSLSDCPRFSGFLYDTKRFVLYNRLAIEQVPLQIYSSALVFAPTRSIIRRQFKNCMPRWIRKLPRVEEEWNTALQTLEGHAKSVNAVAFSPDSKTLASASDDRTVKVWDARSGAVLQTLEGHSASVHACTFLSNSKTLISMSTDGEVSVWDSGTGELLFKSNDSTAANSTVSHDNGVVPPWSTLQKLAMVQHVSYSRTVASHKISPDGKLSVLMLDSTVTLCHDRSGAQLYKLSGHRHAVKAVAFSPDSKMLASVSDDSIRVWSTSSGAQLCKLSGHLDDVKAVVFSPDSKMLALVSDDSIRVWSTSSGAQLCELSGHWDAKAIVFSPDSKMLASVSDDSIRVWSTSSGAQLCELSGHWDDVKAVAFSPDSKMLVLASYGSIRVWSTSSGAQLCELLGHWGNVKAVAFSPDSKILALVSYSSIRVWSTSSGAQLCEILGHWADVKAIVFSPDSKMLASVLYNSIRVWSTSSGAQLYKPLRHRGDAVLFSSHVKAVVFLPDGKMLVSVSDDSIRVWSTSSGAMLYELSGHQDNVKATVFSPDGKLRAEVSDSKIVKLYNIVTGEASRTLEGHSGQVTGIDFSPDAKLLVSASKDKTVRLWDTSIKPAPPSLDAHWDSVTLLAFSPDGKFLASASKDCRVKLWDTDKGALLKTFTGHSGHVSAMVFSPNSKLLASASTDATICLRKAAVGAAVETLKGHSAGVIAVAFSPDGNILASASGDRAVKLWDTAMGRELKTLEGHSGCVRAVAFSPDGKTLASASDDRTVKVWDAGSGTVLQTLKGISDAAMAVAFSPDGTSLYTNWGSLPISSLSSSTAIAQTVPPSSIFIEDQWVRHRTKRILWLPPDHRPSVTAVHSGIIGLGYASGRVIMMELAP